MVKNNKSYDKDNKFCYSDYSSYVVYMVSVGTFY